MIAIINQFILYIIWIYIESYIHDKKIKDNEYMYMLKVAFVAT